MNAAHLHALLNHIPIVGSGFLFLLIILNIISRGLVPKKLLLILCIITAVLTLPAYFTGEEAEHMVEHYPNVSEHYLEEHEESSIYPTIAMQILGVVAIFGLALLKTKGTLPKWYNPLLNGLIILGLILCIRTGFLGGQIMHSEFRAETNKSE